jgi:hypothetical protein
MIIIHHGISNIISILLEPEGHKPTGPPKLPYLRPLLAISSVPSRLSSIGLPLFSVGHTPAEPRRPVYRLIGERVVRLMMRRFRCGHAGRVAVCAAEWGCSVNALSPFGQPVLDNT